MPMIEWSHRFSVGVAEFDEEHMVLLRLINELFDASRVGEGDLAAARVLDGLLDYASTHFEHEERMMREFGYPDIESHTAEHRDLAGKATRLRASLSAEATAGDAPATMKLIVNWLVTHIMGVDAAYGKFLNAKGVR